MSVVGGVFTFILFIGLFIGFTMFKEFQNIFAARWKQEITVVVDTPDGPLTASSVQEIRFTKGIKALGEMDGPNVRFKGEAMEVRIGEQSLFVGVSGAHSLLSYAARDLGLQKHSLIDTVAAMKVHGAPGALRPINYPILVTFADPKDPTTVLVVDPDKMEKVFGPGVTIREITVGRTEKHADTGRLMTRLPWIDAENLPMLLRDAGVEYPDVSAIQKLRNHRY